MYEILRVPHQEDQFMKAFSIMIAYSDPPIYEFDFKEFYKSAKEIYMISDGKSYLGAGSLLHKKYNNADLKYIFKAYDDSVYELSAVDFDKKDSYKKYYDLIRTLLRDSNDRLIICESIPNTDKSLIDALKNNKFKIVVNDDHSDAFYIPIYSKSIEEEVFRINPKDDLHTIDKMNSFHNDNQIKEAQDRYIKELVNEESKEEPKYIEPQTEEEFLGNNCCCRCRGLTKPYIFES